MKDKFINFRATEKEKKQLTILAKKEKMSQADFIRRSVFNKEIVVIDGLKPLQKELKCIGNNLNQLSISTLFTKFAFGEGLYCFYVPICFLPDISKVIRAEKVNEIHFRYSIFAFDNEVLKQSIQAPIIDSSLTVSCKIADH